MFKYFKQTLLLLSCIVSLYASAQNLISPITISLPANPPANTAEWATTLPPVMILAQTKLINGQINGSVVESKILVTIKSGGTKICGSYTAQTAPNSNFSNTTKNWTGANVLSLLGQECILKPGSYELCVQFYGMSPTQGGLIILGENCKPFTIADKKQDAQTFSPPQNINPANEKAFTEKEAKAPITFRWTPVLPKPKDQVTYRLKVWQLMQGQNGTAAMKSNTPVVEKDVNNITQAVVTNLYTGPCKPPYLCEYVWNVEAFTKNDVQGNEKILGASEPTIFKIADNNVDIQIGSLKFGCCENGKQSIYIKVKNNRPTAANIVAIKYKINGIGSAIILTSILPSLPKSIAANSTQIFTTNIECVNGINSIKILVDAVDAIDIDNTETESAFDTLKCSCNLCDTNIVKWGMQQQISYDSTKKNNTLTLSGNINFQPYKVVKLTAEIVDFYWYTEGDCKKCNTNDYYFGNLIGGNIGGTNFTNSGTSVAGPLGTPIPSSHQLDFIANSLSGTTLNNNIALNISLPPQIVLNSCIDCFRFCIRYTATFIENGVCKTCSIVKCYESKRKHRQIELQLYMNQCGEDGKIMGELDSQIKK